MSWVRAEKRYEFHGFHRFHYLRIRGIREICGVFVFGAEVSNCLFDDIRINITAR